MLSPSNSQGRGMFKKNDYSNVKAKVSTRLEASRRTPKKLLFSNAKIPKEPTSMQSKLLKFSKAITEQDNEQIEDIILELNRTIKQTKGKITVKQKQMLAQYASDVSAKVSPTKHVRRESRQQLKQNLNKALLQTPNRSRQRDIDSSSKHKSKYEKTERT